MQRRIAGHRWLALLAFAAPLLAQTAKPFVQASGEGVVNIRPDLMRINAGVTTEGQSAQEAADRNATRVSALLSALRQLLGDSGEIQTIQYSVSPAYRSTTTGGPPTITGYVASNTVQVSTPDLMLAGRIIDAAAQAGANQISGLIFTLQDPEPARNAALKLAAQKARGHAAAIAEGLNVRLGGVLAASEGFGPIVPIGIERGAATAATPIETGDLHVRANITLQIEIVP